MKIKKLFKGSSGLLIISLIVCLFCSFFASLVQSGGFSYEVNEVTIDMDEFYERTYKDVATKPYRLSIGENKDGLVNAKLTGYIYKGRNVNKDNPAPCIVLTHGYLNSKEFEEAPAIEMARRGYVVFAFDQYDHGDSTWDTPSSFNFYAWSVYDAVQYMYSQDYVLKSSDGTGMIAVSGHSMGGFSSELATALDQIELDFHMSSAQKIVATLAVGADFRYVDFYTQAYSGGTYSSTYMAYKNRTCGTIAGEFDEFFFDNDNDKEVIKKDYVSDKVGYSMLGLTSKGKANTFYKVDPSTNTAYEAEESVVSGYGERIIYQVSGDHPYNTWSPEATGRMIEFYDHAFTYQLKLHNLSSPSTYGIVQKSGQIWWLKEVFTCIGLFSLIGALVGGTNLLTRTPIVCLVTTDEYEIVPVEKNSKARKIISNIVTLFSILLNFYLIVPFMNRSGLDLAINFSKVILYTLLVALIGLGIAYIVIKSLHKDDNETKGLFGHYFVGITVIGLITYIFKWLVTDGTSIITAGSIYWSAPSINTIVYWAITSSLLGLIFTLINYFFISKDRQICHLGLKASIGKVIFNLVIAIVVCLGVWLVIFLTKVIFKTDYRVYTYAFNDVNNIQFVTALKYMPLFFIFYLCSGITIAHATAGKKGLKADLLAIAIITLPSALFLLYQYGVLYNTGTAPYPNFSLSGILVQGLILTLVFMSIIQRRALEKTHSIWLGVFINTILFTMITLASTCIYNIAL